MMIRLNNILITGGFGYLGGRVAQFIDSHGGYEIVLGSRSQLQSAKWLPGVRVAQTKWNSLPELEDICAGIDIVLHLAGMNAQDCAADPIAAFEFNAVATARLLRAAMNSGVRRFLYVSTAHVYGSPLIGSITEKNNLNALHPYATSHRAGEDVVRAAHNNNQIEGVVIRLTNAYGTPVHRDVNCWTLLVNDLCRQAVQSQRMVLRSSGRQRRDFVTVTDACRAILHLLELPANLLGDGVFNVGGMWAPTVWEMAEYVARRVHAVVGTRPELIRKEDNDIEDPVFYYDISRLFATGFLLSQNYTADDEVDALVHFCLKLKN